MGVSFEHRSFQPEIMDDLSCGGETLNQTLKELEIINRLLGGNSITLEGIKQLLPVNPDEKQCFEIADLGCGGGDILNLIAQWAHRSGVQVKLYGIDANPNVVAYARKNSRHFPEITYEALDIFSEDFQAKQFDITLCTLFTHHFNQQQLVRLFRNLYQQSRLGVVVNDLHRHWFAYWSILIITRYFSHSTMVKNDAPVSVLRGFLKKELQAILDAASITQYQIKWRWAFRWQLLLWH